MKLLYKIFIVLLYVSSTSLVITMDQGPKAGDIIVDEQGNETTYKPEMTTTVQSTIQPYSAIQSEIKPVAPEISPTIKPMTPPLFIPAVHDLQKGDTDYMPLTEIRPGQVQYSKKNIDIKIGDIQKDPNNITIEIVDPNDPTKTKKVKTIITLGYNNHTSAFDLKGAAPVMKIKDDQGNIKYILTDKHHDTLANREAAKQANVVHPTMPIKVVLDLTNMSYPEFLNYAKNNYLIDLLIPVKNGGYATDLPHSFADMQNNPVRYFVTMSAIKFFNGESPDMAIGLMDLPLWIKRLGSFDKKQPQDKANERMLENVIAQKLIDNGFVYDEMPLM